MTSCRLHVDRSAAPPAGPATADLRHEHEVILRALTIVERVATRLASGQPVSDATLTDLVQFLRAFADQCHHGKEEDHLFPAMRAGGAGDVLAVFEAEHEEGRRYLRTLESSASSPAARATAARRYVGLLRDHIQRENEVLLPMADEFLSVEEHGALARAFADVERRLMGAGGHEALLGTLARLDAAVPETRVAP